MQYFVTGATGFLGSHLVHQLVDGGHEVTALVRTPSKAQLLPGTVEPVEGDVTDRTSMRDAMDGSDGVFHLAGWYQIGGGDARTARRVNVEGTRNVLELAVELDIPKVVYTSSVAVFSDTGGTCVDESYRYSGSHRAVYDRTKWQAHYEVAEPMIESGLPLVIVVPGTVYGPPVAGTGETSDIRTLWQRYLREAVPFVIRSGAACWEHVEDSARAHRLAMDRGEPGETYIIAGEKRTFVEMFELAEELTGVPAPRSISPRWFRMLAPVVARLESVVPLRTTRQSEVLYRMSGATWLVDNSKATTELGVVHRPIEDGLLEYLEWERAQVNRR